MLKHISLASSSKGNVHLLSQDNGETYLMIECGLPLNKIKEKLNELDIDIWSIKACISTHAHLDHSRAVKDLLLYMPVYTTQETFDKLGVNHFNAISIEPNKQFKVDGGFSILPFKVFHDAPNPVNFAIKNNIDEYTIFLTDTSYFELSFKDIHPTLVLIEANFDKELLEFQISESEKLIKRDRGFETVMKKRQLGEFGGHLSYQDTIKLLLSMKLGMCKQIILTHVSATNGYTYFSERVSEALGNKIPVKQLKSSDIEITTIENEIKCDF